MKITKLKAKAIAHGKVKIQGPKDDETGILCEEGLLQFGFDPMEFDNREIFISCKNQKKKGWKKLETIRGDYIKIQNKKVRDLFFGSDVIKILSCIFMGTYSCETPMTFYFKI